MTAGMAEVIAAHYMDRDIYICDCGWVWAEHAGNAGSPLIHADHVAEELAKAGYGNVREAKREAWAEGFRAGWAEAEDPGAFVNDVWDAKTTNPYREPQHG